MTNLARRGRQARMFSNQDWSSIATPIWAILARRNELPTNYTIDLARVTPLMTEELGKLLSRLGAERLVFGSGMPFNYPDPALLNLELLAASDEEREKIRWRNAVRLLRL